MDNIKQVVKDIRFLIATNCCDETIQARIENFINEHEQALRQPTVSGQLNCEHDWLVDMYDHFGFPASRFCDKCNTREAI